MYIKITSAPGAGAAAGRTNMAADFSNSSRSRWHSFGCGNSGGS